MRRFLQSPYASQFADAFVTGVVALHETIDLAAVDDIVAGMEPEQQKVIYLRLARRAAIDGHPGSHPICLREGRGGQDRWRRSRGPIRARCSIPALPRSPPTHVDQTIAKLKGIDRSRLSESDLQLLAAAEAIAAEVTAVPAPPAIEAAAEV